MIGLPTETTEDLYALIKELKRIREWSQVIAEKRGYIPKLIISVNPFVPKPFTRFAACEMAPRKTLSQRIRLLRKETAAIGNTELKVNPVREANKQYKILQAIHGA